MFPSVTRVADSHRLIGQEIESVAAQGKHLLMTFGGGLVLHTHMRMRARAYGCTDAAPTLPTLWLADSGEEDRTRRAAHLLVSAVSS